MDLSGVFAPLTTPFRADGELDPGGMRSNAETVLRTGVRGLVLFGTTGEGVMLDEDERVAALEAVRGLTGAGQVVLAAAGAESTRATIRLTRKLAGAGADGVLVQPPSYYVPQLTPGALRSHYTRVADESPIPVLFYQVPPAYSAAEIPTEVVVQLSVHPRIVGIKDSSGNAQVLRALIASSDPSFSVLVGNGALFSPGIQSGADGGIMAIVALLPDRCVEIFRHARAGDVAAANRLQEPVATVHQAVVVELGVPGIKYAVDLLGRLGGEPRLPLQRLGRNQKERVREVLREAGCLPERARAAAAPLPS